jgi:Fic family protein
MNIQKIHTLRERYFAQALKKQALLDILSEGEITEQVYNSNAIENSTLSLEDTEKILLQIDLDRYISERELFEAKNLARVVQYINKKSKEQELDSAMILQLHKMLISNIKDEIAGKFRREDEWVRVWSYIAVNPKEIPSRIEIMLSNFYASSKENIIERIARFHLTFEHIHPFVDGNGRIGRVINNYLLIREGYVPINIKFIDRKLYYEAFKEFDAQWKIQIMQEIVEKSLFQSYHKRLAYLEGKEIILLKDYAENTWMSYSNALNKAKRQTIEAFLEKGVWKIGV